MNDILSEFRQAGANLLGADGEPEMVRYQLAANALYRALAAMTDKTAPEQEAPLTEQLRLALERTLGNFQYLLARLPVRDAAETIAEANAALTAADIASSPQPKGTRPLTEPPNLQERGIEYAKRAGYRPDEANFSRVFYAYLAGFTDRDALAPRPLVAACRHEWVTSVGTDLQCRNCGEITGTAASLSPAPSITPEPPTATAILGAVARGWCHEKNAKKVMDSALAFAIVAEVSALIDRPASDASSTVAPSESGESLDHPISTSSAPSSSGGPSGLA